MNETNTLPPEMTRLYRVENPAIAAVPNGTTSHEDLVGQWFTPDASTAMNYLRKSTQTFGKGAGPVDGAQVVVAEVPTAKLDRYHVSQNPTAAGMHVEDDNYLVPRDGSVPVHTVPLDETLGELRGRLGKVEKLQEAKARVSQKLGELSLL